MSPDTTSESEVAFDEPEEFFGEPETDSPAFGGSEDEEE